MARWTITHAGVPIVTIDAPSPDHLGAVAINPLVAFDALRPSLTSVWRDAEADEPEPRAPTATVRDLELWDERGVHIPTMRLEIVVTGPRSAVAFISVDTVAVRVGALVEPPPREDPEFARCA
jgi:hypothetical protein